MAFLGRLFAHQYPVHPEFDTGIGPAPFAKSGQRYNGRLKRQTAEVWCKTLLRTDWFALSATRAN